MNLDVLVGLGVVFLKLVVNLDVLVRSGATLLGATLIRVVVLM